jgi:hypothetical protein
MKRAGFTINERGDQGNSPRLPEKFDDQETYGPGSWVGRVRMVRTNLLPIAAHIHAQNEAMRAGQVAGVPAIVPLPDVRQSTARQFQKQITSARQAVSAKNALSSWLPWPRLTSTVHVATK